MKRLLSGLLTTLLTICLFGANRADAIDIPQRPAGYANKTVTIICPFAPGGAIDNSLRALQPILAKYGVDTIVTNVTGSGGVVGAMEAINGSPDGYTVSTIGPGFMAVWVQGMVDFSWDKVTFITRSTMDSNGIFVRTDAEWKNADELVKWIIANPGKFSVGMAGSNQALNMMISGSLEAELGGKDAINILGYDGASRAATELIGGHIYGVQGKMADYISHVRSGLIRPVMSLAAERVSIYEGIQTFNELPYPDIVPTGDPAANTTLVVAAAGLKPEVAEYLQKVFSAAVASDEYQAYAASAGSIAIPLSPEECRKAADAFYNLKRAEAIASGLIEE